MPHVHKPGETAGWYDHPESKVPRSLPAFSSAWEGAGLMIEALEKDNWIWLLRHFESCNPEAVIFRAHDKTTKGGAPAQSTTP